MPTQSNRSYSIDFVKGVAAIFIVCMHCENMDAIDAAIHLIGRLAVPMFFIITGYYLPSMIQSGRIPSHIVKILKLILGGLLLFYLPLYCLDGYLNGDLGEALKLISYQEKTWQKILFGRCPIYVRAGHLWYLFSILYVLCFLYLFTKKYPVKKLYWLIPILFLASYAISSVDYDFRFRLYYQNYLFIGLPYILLGSYIREHSIGQRMSNRSLWLLLGTCVVLYFGEIAIYEFTGLPSHREHYLFIIPLVSVILILASRNPQFGQGNAFAVIGRKYSAYIYVFHLYIVEKMWHYFHGTSLDSKLQMLSSIAITLFIVFVYIHIKESFLKPKVK